MVQFYCRAITFTLNIHILLIIILYCYLSKGSKYFFHHLYYIQLLCYPFLQKLCFCLEKVKETLLAPLANNMLAKVPCIHGVLSAWSVGVLKPHMDSLPKWKQYQLTGTSQVY